jgi:hypothetical protein
MTIITLTFVTEVVLRMYALNLGCQEGEYFDFFTDQGTGLYNVVDLLVTLIDVVSLILERVLAAQGGDAAENEAFGVATILRSLRFVRLIRVMRLMRNQDEVLMAVTLPQTYLMGILGSFIYVCIAWEWVFSFLDRVYNEESTLQATSTFVAEFPILLFFTYPTMFIFAHNFAKCSTGEQIVLDTKSDNAEIQIHMSKFARKVTSNMTAKGRSANRESKRKMSASKLDAARTGVLEDIAEVTPTSVAVSTKKVRSQMMAKTIV